jgi:hypothetical protein
MRVAEITQMQNKVCALAREHGAVILAHNNQFPRPRTRPTTSATRSGSRNRRRDRR